MKRFEAIFVEAAAIRKVTFEAVDLDEARGLALRWGFGLQGELPEVTTVLPAALPPTAPVHAYDVPATCKLLGNVSRTTLYRLLVRGKLERVPHTRKVLVTRRSIERLCSVCRVA